MKYKNSNFLQFKFGIFPDKLFLSKDLSKILLLISIRTLIYIFTMLLNELMW